MTPMVEAQKVCKNFDVTDNFYHQIPRAVVYYGPVTVSVMVSAVPITNANPVITLTNLVPYNATNSTATNLWDYYRYQVSTNAYGVRFEVLNPSGDVTLLARKNPPLPSLSNYDYISANAGTSDELILVLTNSTPVPLTNGYWYLAVYDVSGAPVNYTIQVTELTNNLSPAIVTLTNQVPYTTNNSAGVNALDYYRYTVSSNAIAVQFEVDNPSAAVALVARQGLPLPSLTSYDYFNANPAASNIIMVWTNSTPVPLAPGDTWYFAVVNVTGASVTYTVKATEITNNWPAIITLTNGLPYFNTNSGVGGANDYYRYVVTTNAVRAQFEIDNPTADLTLVARKGLPLPGLSFFDYCSTNSYTNDELIVVFNYSSPVALAPGDWFLTAVNVSGGSAAYTIKATEWPAYGTNIVITNASYSSGSFCLTWTSVTNIYYYVLGLTNMNSTNWVTVSPTITATNTLTTYCIPPPSPLHFFRVIEGLALSTYVPPALSISSVSPVSGSGAGGTLVSILGNSFQSNPSVTFGGSKRAGGLFYQRDQPGRGDSAPRGGHI